MLHFVKDLTALINKIKKRFWNFSLDTLIKNCAILLWLMVFVGMCDLFQSLNGKFYFELCSCNAFLPPGKSWFIIPNHNILYPGVVDGLMLYYTTTTADDDADGLVYKRIFQK